MLLGFFITYQNYTNAELDKTELLMNLKNRTPSTEIGYYQENMEYFFKNLQAFLNIVAILKIISVDF